MSNSKWCDPFKHEVHESDNGVYFRPKGDATDSYICERHFEKRMAEWNSLQSAQCDYNEAKRRGL